MADESTQSIVIDAAPEQVMAVIADFPAYPDWADAVKDTEVLSEGVDGWPEQVRFRLNAGPIKDEYVLAYQWAGDGLSVRWHLVRGQIQKSQEGSYVLEPAGGATTVTYRLAVDLSIPMIGMLKRKAAKVIMDTALRELKRRVEA